MPRLTIFLVLLIATGCVTTPIYYPQPHELWPLVAKSHLIVTGTLIVPVEQIRACLISNEHRYVELIVITDQFLKGNAAEQLAIRWYTEPRDYAPHPEHVMSFDGKKSFLFLVHVDDDPAGAFYFVRNAGPALSDLEEAFLEQLQSEITVQRELLARFEEIFPPDDEPLSDRVANLIEATTREATQSRAFRRLETLGSRAVPAIIMLMDDRRDLAVPEITLRNHPGHWEYVRHYGPEKVVDAMAAILNQITGVSFGNIYNGGSERERREVVNGWRVYLYYWKKGTLND
jgi:hypothetical protein